MGTDRRVWCALLVSVLSVPLHAQQQPLPDLPGTVTPASAIDGAGQAHQQIIQIATPDPVVGAANGGIRLVPPPLGGNAFVAGGGQLFITAPTLGDTLLALRPYDNNQGADIIAENQSGNVYFDNRYRNYTETIFGTGTIFRMNTGGNVNTGPDAAGIFTLMTLWAGGTSSGTGMVGLSVLHPQAGFHVNMNVTAGGALAGTGWGTYLSQIMTATTNGDDLTALRIDPTFTDGGKSGVTHTALYLGAGDVVFSGVVSGAATGKRVVCIDSTTKKLYMSSTGTDCSN